MLMRALSKAEDLDDLALEQWMQLFGTWVHTALKNTFPFLFRKPLATEVVATEERWKQNCSYAMLSVPPGEWWTPILAVREVLQIYNPHVSELHEILRNFNIRLKIRQTIYASDVHPEAGSMVAISDRGEGVPALKVGYLGKWNDLLKLVPPGILYL